MIMPETHRENRHRADTAQRKTCQTVQKPDIINNSFPGHHGNFERCAAYYWYFRWWRRDAKAGAGTEMLLALPELGRRRGEARQDCCLDGSQFAAPFPIGNEDMTCPATGLLAAVDQLGYEILPVAWPAVVVASKGVITEFVRCHRRPDRNRRTGLTDNRAARPSLSRGGTPSGGGSCCPTPPFSHSPSHPLRDAAVRRPRLAPTSGLRTLAGGAGPMRVAPERVSHGQQNAYRRVSPRRNQSGRPSR
jgi:hypothetical protein